MTLKPILSIAFCMIISSCSALPDLDQKAQYPTLYLTSDVSAEMIMQNAHEAAGGETWSRPKSLAMDGFAVFYKDNKPVTNEHHRMWRVYEAGKTNAHTVDGKVRIESISNGTPVINLSFDGKQTYTDGGAQAKSASDKQWSSSFGFGVVRHALDDGFSLRRLPDDLIDGRPAYMIGVTDPEGGETQFGIAIDDYAILKVAFDTPRGWHERIYSNFFSNPSENWVQPGRVRLYYNGIKGNEVIWTSYAINTELPDCLFTLPEPKDCR